MFPFPIAGTNGVGNFPDTGIVANNGTGITLFQGNVVELDWLQANGNSTVTAAQIATTGNLAGSSQLNQGLYDAVIPTAAGIVAGTAFAVVKDDNQGAGIAPGGNVKVSMLGTCQMQFNPFYAQTLNFTGSPTGGSVIFNFTNTGGTIGSGTATYSTTTATTTANLLAAIGGISGIGTANMVVTSTSSVSFQFLFSGGVVDAGLVTIQSSPSTGQGLTGGSSPLANMGIASSFTGGQTSLGTMVRLSPVPGQTYVLPVFSPNLVQVVNIALQQATANFFLSVPINGVVQSTAAIAYSATVATMATNIQSALNALTGVSGVVVTALGTSSANFQVVFPPNIGQIGIMFVNAVNNGTFSSISVSSGGTLGTAGSQQTSIGFSLDTFGTPSLSSAGVLTFGGVSATTGNPGASINSAPAINPSNIALGLLNTVAGNPAAYNYPQCTITAFINGIPQPR